MKIFYTFLICLGLAMPLAAQEETCPPTGVTTNPDAPVNDLHPFHRNEYFDWRDYRYDVQLDQNENICEMTNPNEYAGGGVYHLADDGDYLPEDGWELLYVDLGLDRHGNWNPDGSGGEIYIILYNKYRSLIRVFVAIAQVGENNLVKIRLSMDGGYNTALFAAIDKVQQPLKHFDPSIVASNTQVFYNSGGPPNWFYADFPVNYDPCTCEPVDGQTSEIILQVDLLEEGHIALKGSSGGTIKIDKQSPSSSASSHWDNFYGTVKDVNGTIKAGRKGYKDFDAFKVDTKGTADSTRSSSGKKTDMKSGIDNLGRFLTDNFSALKYVPYASEALAIIDFFVSGGKKSGQQKVTFPPISIQLEHSFSGSLTYKSSYMFRGLYTPGSSFTPLDNTTTGEPKPNGDAKYPVYNEILGLYTLLEKPKVKMWKGYSSQWYEFVDGAYPGVLLNKKNIIRRGFIMPANSIKIAVNEASNLTLKEAYMQLIYSKGDTVNKFIEGVEGTVVTDSLWVSPLVPVGCVDDRLLATEIIQNRYNWPYGSSMNDHQDIGVDISLVLAFESNKGDRFLHKATWQCDLEEVQYSDTADKKFTQWGADPFGVDDSIILSQELVYNWFDKPEFENLETGFFNAQEDVLFNNYSVEGDTSAVESIALENSTIEARAQPPVNNGYTNLLAGQSIEVLPDSEILPNSDIQVSLLGMNCNIPVTFATASEIASICEGQDYQGQKILTKDAIMSDLLNDPEIFSILTFPNPAVEYLKISLSENASGIDEIEVTVQDLMGRLMYARRKITRSEGLFEINISNLTPGIYIVQVSSRGYKAKSKIVVK